VVASVDGDPGIRSAAVPAAPGIMERFAKRHHQAFAAALDLELPQGAPCDSTFLLPASSRVELEELFWVAQGLDLLAQIAESRTKDFRPS